MRQNRVSGASSLFGRATAQLNDDGEDKVSRDEGPTPSGDPE